MHDHPRALDGAERSPARDRRLWIAVGINVLLTIAQVVGGLAAGSLSLVADALHNLNDAASIGIALAARRIGRRPPDKRLTYGYRRAELIGAMINLTALIMVGLYVIYEAVRRLFDQQGVDGWLVIAIAAIALVIDVATATLTYSMSKGSLNIKAAFVHNLSDALASVGVIIAGTLIILYEWYWTDLAATLAISTYILWQGATMMRSVILILMDGAPPGVDFDSVVAAMEAVPGVESVHHVHLRQLDEDNAALEAHVLVQRMDESVESIKLDLRERLAAKFSIVHTTLEFENRRGRRTQCRRPARALTRAAARVIPSSPFFARSDRRYAPSRPCA